MNPESSPPASRPSGAPASSRPGAPQLSVVAPMFNEAENLSQFFERVEKALSPLNMSYEIVCINDGSRDNTLEKLREQRTRNPAIKIVNLSRNFGKDIALSAGIDHARGDAVVPIDSDLQDPPELIPEFVAKWREGFDVVYATRRSRQGEGILKRVSADLFYRTIAGMTHIDIPKNTGDFRLMDRRVVNAMGRMPERSRFMKGLFAWVGFRQTAILYDREPRHKGRTKWNYWRLWNFALDGITSFSSFPLKVWSYIGVTIAFISFAYAFLRIVGHFFGVFEPMRGYDSTLVTILFLGGIQLISLGVIGEYMARIYIEVKGRPLYLVRDVEGFEGDKTGNANS
ncbi:MAG TPA: glycosyltransferase family 2 protein [Planctomycetota bacterium]|nr:glycosyltransferase family 2 protein [Planctomycetota bacterium]